MGCSPLQVPFWSGIITTRTDVPINSGNRIAQKGRDDMDYRKEIKKLIDTVKDQEKLRIIYRFIRKYIED